MKVQFKYAFRQSLSQRLSGFAIMVLINLVFGIIGYFGLLPAGIVITGVVFSSLALTAIFVTNIIADAVSLRSVFGAPHGYLTALTPVKSHRILFARVVTIICEDVIALAVGIFGVLWQAFVLAGLIGTGIDPGNYLLVLQECIQIIGLALFEYVFIVMLVIFGVVLKRSIFFGKRGGGWLALLGVASAAWLLFLLNFALIPFAPYENWWLFFSITLVPGFNAGTFVYALTALIRIAALFYASSELLERRINLS